jgi:hypothetical protein
MDAAKLAEYKRASATCKLKLGKALDDIDREFVRPHTIAHAWWITLKAKYATTTPQENHKDLKRITSF